MTRLRSLAGQAGGFLSASLSGSRSSGVPAFSGVIDSMIAAGDAAPNFAASISHRLYSAYSGSLFLVRRASDAATQAIGFDADGFVDTATLATFCSGTTGTIVTLYDQSGNARDVTNATVAEQPTIYTAGAITGAGSLPMALFNGGAGTANTGDGWSRADSIGISGASAVSVWAFAANSNVATATETVVLIGTGANLCFRFGDLVTQNISINNSNVAGAAAYRSFTPVAALTIQSDYLASLAAGANFSAATLRQRGTALAQFGVLSGTLNVSGASFGVGASEVRDRGWNGTIGTWIVSAYVPSAGSTAALDSLGSTMRTLAGV